MQAKINPSVIHNGMYGDRIMIKAENKEINKKLTQHANTQYIDLLMLIEGRSWIHGGGRFVKGRQSVKASDKKGAATSSGGDAALRGRRGQREWRWQADSTAYRDNCTAYSLASSFFFFFLFCFFFFCRLMCHPLRPPLSPRSGPRTFVYLSPP